MIGLAYNQAFQNQPQVGGSGLIGYWTFNDQSGSIAHDFSGHYIHGTITAAPFVGGKNSSGLYFSGSASIALGKNVLGNQLNGHNGITFTCWCNLTSTGSNALNNRIINVVIDSTGTTGFSVGNFAGVFEVGARSTKTDSFSIKSITAPATGSWQHIAGVVDYSASKVGIYLNGILQGSLAAATFQSASYVQGVSTANDTIQIDAGTQISTINGVFDEMRMYNRCLTATEIAMIYSGSA